MSEEVLEKAKKDFNSRRGSKNLSRFYDVYASIYGRRA